MWVRRSRLHVVHRGIYAIGHPVLRLEGRWMAAVLAGGPGAVLSHRSAAVCWGLLGEGPARHQVTTAASRRGVPGIRLHRSRSLDAGDTASHRGIPITSVARTLLDLAASLPRHHLERALAQAERLQLYDHRAIADTLARANGHRGRGALAEATAREPRFTRSDLEAKLLDIVREAGLPQPLTNTVLAAPDHARLEVDLYWPTYRLIVELDGYEAHGTRRAFENDRRRDAALQAAGYRVLRFSYRDVTRAPHTVLARVIATAGGGRSTAAGHLHMMSDIV
jgi:very-short-patch-repair endonuclease